MPNAKEQQPQLSEQDAANAKDPNHPAHPEHPHVCASHHKRPRFVHFHASPVTNERPDMQHGQ